MLLRRRLAAEGIGTGMLVAAVIGSGIMAQRLSPDDVGLQLLENTIATAGALVAIILAFGHVSGAHLNPVVTIVDRIFGGLKSTKEAVGYVIAQIVGGVIGAIIANLMFGLDAVNLFSFMFKFGRVSKAFHLKRKALLSRQPVESHKTNVVSGKCIFWTDIAKPSY